MKEGDWEAITLAGLNGQVLVCRCSPLVLKV